MTTWIRWFDDVGMKDVPVVGGKNASLGEMRRALTPLGIRTPNGFATTADAYREFRRAAGLERVIAEALGPLDVADIEHLQMAGSRPLARFDLVCGAMRSWLLAPAAPGQAWRPAP